MESYGWAGGGEILDVGGGEISKATNMNDSLMQQFFALPYVQVIIAVLLLFLAFWVILKISNRRKVPNRLDSILYQKLRHLLRF